MSRIRRRIAERLKQVQNTAAILTTFNEIDMSAVLALRAKYNDAFKERYGIALGFMSLFAKASVEALRAFPAINAEIRKLWATCDNKKIMAKYGVINPDFFVPPSPDPRVGVDRGADYKAPTLPASCSRKP